MDIDGVDMDDGTVASGAWQQPMMAVHGMAAFANIMPGGSAIPVAPRPFDPMPLPALPLPTSMPIPAFSAPMPMPSPSAVQSFQPQQLIQPRQFFLQSNWTPQAFQAIRPQPPPPPPTTITTQATDVIMEQPAPTPAPTLAPTPALVTAEPTPAVEEPTPPVVTIESPPVTEPAPSSPVKKGPKTRASDIPTDVHEIIVRAKEMRLKTTKQPARKLTESRETGMRPLDVALAEARIISENVYVQRKPRTWEEDEVPVCTCKLPEDPDQKGCQEDCVNRAALIECLAEYCPCGNRCDNQRIQRGIMPEAEVIDAGKKGLGIMTRQFIKQGDFVGEYMGEIVTEQEYHLRRLRYHNEKHRYMMVLSGGEVIDATRMGGLARFINHSCEPNCGVEKWEVNGEERCAIFALRDIHPGEELSFDYKFQSFSAHEITTCLCGSAKCRGYIGTNNRVTKQPSKSYASHAALPGDRSRGLDPITKKARSRRKTLVLALERMHRALAGQRLFTRKEIDMVHRSRLLLKRNLTRHADDSFRFLSLEPYFLSDEDGEFLDMEPLFQLRELPDFPVRADVVPKATRQERLEVVLERLRTLR